MDSCGTPTSTVPAAGECWRWRAAAVVTVHVVNSSDVRVHCKRTHAEVGGADRSDGAAATVSTEHGCMSH
jgi:hypothetical protein